MSFAGARFNTPDVMEAPLVVEVGAIVPTLVIPAGLAHEGIPDAKVKTCPSVPLANRVPVPEVPP